MHNETQCRRLALRSPIGLVEFYDTFSPEEVSVPLNCNSCAHMVKRCVRPGDPGMRILLAGTFKLANDWQCYMYA